MSRKSADDRKNQRIIRETINEANQRSAEDRKVAYLLKVAEQSIHINPSLSQQYLIKAQCICRKYDISFPAAFPYIFCSHCACLINTTNTTSYKIVTIPSKAKSKYHNRIVRVCKVCGKQVTTPGVKNELIPPRLKRQIKQIKSAKQVKPASEKKNAKFNIKRQAANLLSSNRQQQKPVKMRTDWEI